MHLAHVRRDVRVFDTFERFHVVVVKMLHLLAPREDVADAPQLRQAQRGSHITHCDLIRQPCGNAHRETFIETARAMLTQRLGDVRVVGHHHAAFAAHQRAGLREIENRAVAEAADQFVLIARTDRFSGILDQHQTVPLRERAQFIPGGGMAVGVTGDDGMRLRGDLGLDFFRRDRAGPVVDVGEHRRGAGERDGVGDLMPGVRRHDDVATWPDAVAAQAQQQSRRAAGHRDRMLASEIGREFCFECGDGGTIGEMRRLQHGTDGVELGRRDIRVRQRNPVVCHDSTPLR